jgi:hypothetical protein
MKVLNLILGLIAVTVLSCGSSKPTQAQINILGQLVENQHFVINSDWAYPQTTMALQQVLNSGLLSPGSTAGSINLIGNPNFLSISGDSITSYLPYFGERQMQTEYGGSDSAIQMKGLMEDFKIEKIKNHNYRITFKAKSKSENFDVYINLSPNLKSNIVLNGTYRFPIRYAGNVKQLVE